jgi:hypothetical protein
MAIVGPSAERGTGTKAIAMKQIKKLVMVFIGIPQ